MKQSSKSHNLFKIEEWRDARRLRAFDEFDETNQAKRFANLQWATDLYLEAWHYANSGGKHSF